MKILLSIPFVILAWLVEVVACLLFWVPVRVIWGKNTLHSLRSERGLADWLMTELKD
ncbi:hypothetical protein [Fibrella aquatica]|uniref:hypothetical protein n=1 Tax=Fibrella aquatica TaxID=3242487 RepID=UPI003520B28D